MTYPASALKKKYIAHMVYFNNAANKITIRDF